MIFMSMCVSSTDLHMVSSYYELMKGQLLNSKVKSQREVTYHQYKHQPRTGLPLSFFSWAYVRQVVYFWAYGTPGVSIFGVRQAFRFLPRCMKCRRGLAIRILSVYLSVRSSNPWIVTKRKKVQSRFVYHALDNLV